MDKKFTQLACSVILAVSLSYSEPTSLILESDCLETTLGYFDTDCLGVFDIDNTLICPSNTKGIGSDEWFCALVDHEVKSGSTYKDAVEKYLPHYTTIQKRIAVKPVQLNTPDIIKALQDRQVLLMGLTFRSDQLADVIIKQLYSVDIDLSRTCPCSKTYEFKYQDMPVIFVNGIMLTNGQDKGEVFKILLSHIQDELSYLPKKIVCVDDKLKNLISVGKVANELGIDFVGIRYAHLDEQVRSYQLPSDPFTIYE